MILWIMLAVGLISLAMSIYSFKWHDELNKELSRNAKCVDYLDYLLSGFGAYLLLPASLFIIGGAVYCLLVK